MRTNQVVMLPKTHFDLAIVEVVLRTAHLGFEIASFDRISWDLRFDDVGTARRVRVWAALKMMREETITTDDVIM